ncbi:MAG: NUDIX hydrolase [Polyangia bacterium]
MSVARQAATVVVLRPSCAGAPQVLMVRRTRGASFMADAFVFPGGRVDEADGEGDVGHRNAAARELFEEAAVRVEPCALVPLSRWITPSREPKRFDARFFVVAVPAGTEARVDEAEVTELLWATAAEILERQGQMMLPPPTLRTLEELAPLPSIEAVLAHASAREVHAIQPKLLDDGLILLPWDPEFAAAEGEGEGIAAAHPLAGGTTRYLYRDGRFTPQSFTSSS